jgi:hypothetical protein
MTPIQRDEGAALLLVVMAVALIMALGLALLLTTSSETVIASNFRNSIGALYAADGAIERVVDDLSTVADWNMLLAGTIASTFIDGAPNLPRTLPDGTTIDLSQQVSLANCRKSTGCSAAEMSAITAERPWGANNPHWRLYAHGSLHDAAPASSGLQSPFYVVVMVGDDPSENDNDPTRDGADAANPGAGVISVRAEAFGPRGTHKIVEATLAASYNEDGSRQPGMRMLSWREVR